MPQSGRVASFGEYKRTAKRQQADAEEEEAELEAAAAAAKRQKLAHHQHHHRQKREGSAGGADAAADPKERATRELREFIKVGVAVWQCRSGRERPGPGSDSQAMVVVCVVPRCHVLAGTSVFLCWHCSAVGVQSVKYCFWRCHRPSCCHMGRVLTWIH